MNYSHQAVCRNELSICKETLIYTIVSIEDFLLQVISLCFLNTGSDAYIGESFPDLGLCFVFKKDFSKTLFKFYQQIFHHLLSLEHHGSI